MLDTTYATFADEPGRGARVRALIQLMRYSGLAIRDALTLKREEITHDKTAALYSIVTSRQKIGTHVSVPIPPDVAQEILAVANGNPVYVFWSGKGDEESATKNWAKYLARLFDDAKITSGHMRSHRLRDTFAVELLQNGVPLEEVSKLLGHESIKTTELSYAKWVKGRQDRLNSLVTATWKKYPPSRYFFAARIFAHLARCAAAIRFLPAADILRARFTVVFALPSSRCST